MTDQEMTQRVLEALNRSEIMALSTVDPESGTWTSPVQYRWDSELSLFFSSLPDARHVRNIARDGRVSVAIYAFPGPPGGNLGLQIGGHARALPEDAGGDWQRFEITPSEVWYFESRRDRRRHRVEMSSVDLASTKESSDTK